MEEVESGSQKFFEDSDQEFSISNQISQQNQNTKKQISQKDYPRNPKTPDHNSYVFPIKLLENQKLSGKSQFKTLLREEAKENILLAKSWRVYKHQLTTHQFSIYVRCLNCRANIHYHQNQDQTWSLVRYKNHHVHKNHIQDPKAYKLLTRLALFQNSHLPSRHLPKISHSQPMNRISLLQKKKGLLKDPKFSLIRQLLRFLQYEYLCEHNAADLSKTSYPETLVAVSLQQKINYQRYGECISYDITYNCIKQTAFNGKRFGIGMFSGFDNNKRIIVFGFSITTYQTIADFKNVFNWFFQLMKGTDMRTTAIITDQQQSLISALEQLKKEKNYGYHHIYDNWHLIRSVIKSLKGQSKDIIKVIANKLVKTMRQSDPNVGMVQLNILKQMMLQLGLKKQYDRIQSKIQHICLWKMPKQFIGLSQHSNEGLNDLLKLKVEYETTFYQLIERLDKVSKERNIRCQGKKQYENYPFEIFFNDNRIKEVRDKFEKKVFNSFAFNYHRAQFYQIVQEIQETHQYKLQHIIQNYQYKVKNWKCQCGTYEKTGVPCQHIIFIHKTKYPDQGFVNLFNERWLISKQKKVGGILTNTTRKRRKRNQII